MTLILGFCTACMTCDFRHVKFSVIMRHCMERIKCGFKGWRLCIVVVDHYRAIAAGAAGEAIASPLFDQI